MTSTRRLLRILRNLVLLFLALVMGAVAVFTLTQRGRDNLAGLISTMASSEDLTVHVDGLSGIWSGDLRLDNVVIGDRQGPWLALRGVAVDWSPTALLSRTFHAERVAAQRIELARLPQSSEQPADSQSGSFSLPVSVDIEKIDLPDIAMGEVLAGSGVAQLSASGLLKAERGTNAIQSQLNVARIDGQQGTIDADVDFAPGDNRLVLNLKASEPQGGIIANLLGLQGQPAILADLSGEGPLSDWTGKGSFSIDGSPIAQLTGRHQEVEAGRRIEVKGDGQFERFVPEMLKQVLSGSTTFDVAGTLLTSGGVDLERADIASGGLTTSGSGVINPEGASDFHLQIDTGAQPVALTFGGDAQKVETAIKSATLRVFGDGAEPMLDLGASLAYVFAGGTKVHNLDATVHSDGFNVANRSGPLAINLTAGRLETDVATLAPLVAGQVKASLEGSIDQTQILVDAGTITSDSLNGTMKAKVALADLAVELAVTADVATTALPAAVRGPLADRVQFSATATRDGEGAFAANEIQLTSGPLTATGLGSLNGDQLSADVKGSFSDISRVAPAAKGAIDFALVARGPLSGPDLSFDIGSSKLEAMGREIDNLKLTATGRADFANPAADVKLSGTVAGEPLSGNAVLRTADGQRRIDGLSLSLGQNRIVGDIVLDDKFIPVGKIDVNLPDVGPLAALALDNATGDVTGTITFAKPGDVPQVLVKLATAALTRGDLSARNVAIDAQVQDYINAPTIAGTVRAGTVTSGSTVIRDINVALTRDGEWTGFDGRAVASDIPAQAVGRVRVAGGTTTVDLASAKATVRGIEAAITRRTTVTVANGNVQLNQLVVSLGNGTATVNGTAGSALNLNVALANVPAALANTFSPGLGLAGSINGTVRVTGQAANPSVAYDLKASGVQAAAISTVGVGALGITSTGTFANNRLQFQATVSEGSGISVQGGGSVGIAGTPSLDLAFNGRVPFAFLNRQLAAQSLALDGTAQLDVQVRGPASAPVISGTVRTSGARVVYANAGLAINNLAADVAIANNVARINSVTGTLSSGGRLSASGTVGVAPGSGFPADITITMADARYTDGQVVVANFNADLAIRGPLVASPALSGTIRLARTVVTIPTNLPASLSQLNVQHLDPPPAVAAQDRALRPEEASGGQSGLNLDLTIDAQNQIFIQGRGVDAELGGNLRLVGPASSPNAEGRFVMNRGRLEVLGQRLDFTSGAVTFSGSTIPYLDFSAQSSASDATVTIAVTGAANNPHFAFSSVPALPEDEVLARLIFGRSMSNLSPLQIAQLASAAAELAGVGGATSLLTTLRNRLGVDDLDIRTTDTGGTSVSVGRYLNDRTYLRLEKGDQPGSGRVGIDLNLGKGVKLRGQASDDGEAKGGIFYEKEY